MQMFIFLVLLAVTTTLDAAIVQDAGGIDREELFKGIDHNVLPKAGKTMQSLGKVLQGDFSLFTAEERDSVLDAIKALSITDELENETDKHIAPIVGIIISAIVTAAAGAGAERGVSEIIKAVKEKRRG